MVGKITLFKAILASILIQSMQTNLLPVSVCESINAHNRKFIQGSFQTQKKSHLVLWNDVCYSKQDRGLSLQQSRLVNKPLIMKLAFAILRNNDALQIKVLRNKYKCGEFATPIMLYKSCDSNIWKGITKAWEKVIQVANSLMIREILQLEGI